MVPRVGVGANYWSQEYCKYFGLRILRALPVCGPSVLLILPALAVFRSPVLQYSQYSGERNVLDTPEHIRSITLHCEHLLWK